MAFHGDFIGGEFRWASDPSGEWQAKSPADLSQDLGRVIYSFSAMESAVGAARGAFEGWRRLSPAERMSALKRVQGALLKRDKALAAALSLEIGKPDWEAKTEAVATINKLDALIADGLKPIQDAEVPEVLDMTRGTCKFRPLGVIAVVTPFSFPALSLISQAGAALLTGNTVVVKPSEKAPLVAQIIAEAFQEAQLPPGVFNLIQGGPEIGRRLTLQEGVDAIFFTGSHETGNRIQQDTLHQSGKMLHLQMGGKNPIIVWSDAQFEQALHECLISTYLSAGQRCTSASRVIVHSSLAEKFVAEFHARAKKFQIGHPSENPFMGPLIEAGAVDRYLKFLGIAVRESGEILMRGKTLETAKKGHYVTPSVVWLRDTSLETAKKSVFQQTEILAPVVGVLAVDDLDHALALANCSSYGLVASVFSTSPEVFAKCRDTLQYGLIYWNKATIGGSGRLPFCGIKKSGNLTPGGSLTTLSTVRPVTTLEMDRLDQWAPFSYPGLN